MTSATGKRTIELTTRKTQKTRESARRSIPEHLASGAGEGPAGLGRPGSSIGRGRGGRLPETNRAPSRSATRAALAGYHHRRGDGGGREAAGSRALESDVDIGATWAGVIRMVALRRPVQVLLASISMLNGSDTTRFGFRAAALAVFWSAVSGCMPWPHRERVTPF